MSIFKTIFIVILLGLLGNIRTTENGRMFFNEEFHLNSIDSIGREFIHFTDTIPNDTLYVCYSKTTMPVAVYRNIRTGVCADGQCRIVYIRIYWAITGRYLGYQLNSNQELTKKEHDPFSESDYLLLHKVLGDSLSLLAHYTLAELHPKQVKTKNTDGISGATLPNLNGYIVPDAAYTSHALWHLVYGETRDSLRVLSQKYINASLLDSLLNSKNRYDCFWAMNKIGVNGIPASHYALRVLYLLSTNDYFIIEKALQFLDSYPPPDAVYQQAVFRSLLISDYPSKRLFLERLNKMKHLQTEVARGMIDRLPAETPYMVNAFISILETTYIPSQNDLQMISNLLNHTNRQVSLRVYSYLNELPHKKLWLTRKLKMYARTIE